MSLEYGILEEDRQEEVGLNRTLIEQLTTGLDPLLERLDAYLDKRLVRTLVESVAALLVFRNPKQGLHVSELGAYIKNGAQAPAGTKKLERLLHSEKWGKDLIDQWHWERAQKKGKELKAAGKRVLCIWDGSRIEKPESEKTEGMCAVLSSKAKRLKKNRKGIWNPPKGKPITVLGIEWNGLLIAGMQGVAQVAAMDYWSRKGEHATTQREVEKRLLRKASHHLGKDVVHIFDRGYAGAPWLEVLNMQKVPFVIRWKGNYSGIDETGEDKAIWKIARGKRSWGQREIEMVQGKKTVKKAW